MFRSPQAVFAPSSIAFVGASERPGLGNWTMAIYESLIAAGTQIPLYPVNPRVSQIWGRECYPSVSAIPEPIDLALVVVPAPAVPDALEQSARADARAAVVYSSGFGEGGDAAGAVFGERPAHDRAGRPEDLRTELHG